ncbi:MAG: hypothetical protein Q9202_005108 [Teloschistes flavicans]
MPSNKTAIGIIIAIITYWVIVISVPALREFHDPSQVGVINGKRCRIACRIAGWRKKEEVRQYGDDDKDWNGETPVSPTIQSPVPTAATATTTSPPHLDWSMDDLMRVGFSEETSRQIYQALRDKPAARKDNSTSRKDESAGRMQVGGGTRRIATKIVKGLKRFAMALLYLGSVLASCLSCSAAVLWYAGRKGRARDRKKRLEKERREREKEEAETWRRTGFRTIVRRYQQRNFVTRCCERVWNRLHEKLSPVLHVMAVGITLSCNILFHGLSRTRDILIHGLSRTRDFILQVGSILIALTLPPYLLYRIFLFLLREPHERENGGGFDQAFAMAIHACIDHPLSVIVATLVTACCFMSFLRNGEVSEECYLCPPTQQVNAEPVNMGKLCRKHMDIENKYREVYEQKVRKKEEEMIRERWSPGEAAKLPSGERFSPVPWHPLPLYDFSSLFPEMAEEEDDLCEESPSFTSTPRISKVRKERFS